jgi:hypothetical protein
VDGRAVGAAPVRTSLPIGRYTVEVRSADGRQRASEQVLVRAGRTSELLVSLPDAPPPPPAPAPAVASSSTPAPAVVGPAPSRAASFHPVADVRVLLYPFQLEEGAGIEVGGGVQNEHLRATLHAQLYSEFGLTLRGAAIVPVTGHFSGYVSGELPMIFFDTTAVGLGGAAGAEFAVNPWLTLFGELGARHFFTAQPAESNRLTLQGGARLRLP